MKRYGDMWFGGLFFQQAVFDALVRERYAFAHGLAFIAGIGLLVGLLAVLRAAERYIFSPPADAIKATVLNHLQRMPWYVSLERTPEFVKQFQDGYDTFWRFFGSLFLPNPTDPTVLAGIIVTPLVLILVWVLYGVLVHFFALLLGGQGNLGHALGALALGTAPQTLSLFTLLPGFEPAGGLVGLWTLLINYVAVRTAYRFTPGRAFWATMFPLLFLLFVLVLLALIAAGMAVRGGAR